MFAPFIQGPHSKEPQVSRDETNQQAPQAQILNLQSSIWRMFSSMGTFGLDCIEAVIYMLIRADDTLTTHTGADSEERSSWYSHS